MLEGEVFVGEFSAVDGFATRALGRLVGKRKLYIIKWLAADGHCHIRTGNIQKREETQEKENQ